MHIDKQESAAGERNGAENELFLLRQSILNRRPSESRKESDNVKLFALEYANAGLPGQPRPQGSGY